MRTSEAAALSGREGRGSPDSSFPPVGDPQNSGQTHCEPWDWAPMILGDREVDKPRTRYFETSRLLRDKTTLERPSDFSLSP